MPNRLRRPSGTHILATWPACGTRRSTRSTKTTSPHCESPGGSTRTPSGHGRTTSIRPRRWSLAGCSTPRRVPGARSSRSTPRPENCKWIHTEDEGQRGLNAPRNGAGRGVSYWSSPDGSDQRIIYVTPGYRMIALNARTGVPISTFGKDGVVDLKLENDQVVDLGHGRTRPECHAPHRGRHRGRGCRPPGRRRAESHEQREGLRARLRRQDRQAPLDLPHDSEARRVRLRHVGRRGAL